MDRLKKKHEIESLIVKKIGEDKNFEKLLSSNPHEALKTLGFAIPTEIKLKIVQENQGEIILVVPHHDQNKDDLTDLELRYSSGGQASGGGSWGCPPPNTISGCNAC